MLYECSSSFLSEFYNLLLNICYSIWVLLTRLFHICDRLLDHSVLRQAVLDHPVLIQSIILTVIFNKIQKTFKIKYFK